MQSITVNFKPSSKLILLLSGAGLSALVIVLYLYVSGALIQHALVSALCALIIFATAYAVCNQALMLLPWSCTGLIVQADRLILIRRDQRQLRVRVLATTTVHVHLTVLDLIRVDEQNTRINERFVWLKRRFKNLFFATSHVLVTHDKCLEGHSFRRLRVWLTLAAINNQKA